jgi:hypothetical protein
MNERQPVRSLLDRICAVIGPRIAGSAEEERAARLLEEELESWGVEASLERFRVAPAELHALVVAGVIGYVVSTAAYFVAPAVTLAVLTALALVLAVNRLFDVDLVEAVLPKRWSTNVLGKIAPSGERQQIVIFAGHHDSAYHMPLLRHRGLIPVLLVALVMIFASAVALWALALWKVLVATDPGAVMRTVELAVVAVCLAGSAVAVALAAGTLRSDGVPGANDNLSAVAVAWELGRALAARPARHTEIWVVSFGAEELGLKGSREFARVHAGELAGAVLVNLECLGQSGRLRVLTGELIALTRHSERAVSLVEEAAVNAQVHIRRKLLVPGLTDATSFSRRGLAATTLIRLNDDGYLDHYHTPGDRPESVSEDNLAEALGVCLEVVRAVDGPGLDDSDPDSSVPPGLLN